MGLVLFVYDEDVVDGDVGDCVGVGGFELVDVVDVGW